MTCDDSKKAGSQVPGLLDLRVSPGLQIAGHAYVLSPLPCCARTALPFAAKVFGGVRNTGTAEVAVTVAVTLFDAHKAPIGRFTEFTILDSGEKTEFGVTLPEISRDAAYYSVDIEGSEDFSL